MEGYPFSGRDIARRSAELEAENSRLRSQVNAWRRIWERIEVMLILEGLKSSFTSSIRGPQKNGLASGKDG
jgi:hypothetical protein